MPAETATPGEDTSMGPSHVRCCIAGCGPAGAVLAFLLARAGVDVLVLEKHGDFLRDFRGDTIHPSTLEILDQLGLADRFLHLPHRRVSRVTFTVALASTETFSVELGRLRTRFPFIALVPQWDFLNFLTEEAKRFPGFRLLMNAEVTDLIQEDGAVRGIRYRTASGEHDVRSVLVVGADGRSSRTREAIHLPQVTASPPMDVFWFRLSRRPDDPGDVNAMAGPGHFLVFFDRGEYWQVAYAIPKGGAADVRAAGLEAFRRAIVTLASQFADRVAELQDWDQVKLLTVQADRLRRWYADGYIAIGDAAHAMSPVGGVGINVAIQDAVAAANVLWDPLRQGRVRTRDLAAVQRRRDLPVRVIQAVQGVIQDRLLRTVLAAQDRSLAIPPLLRLAFGTPGLRGLMPRLIAFGPFRPHVESPALPPLAPLAGSGAAGGTRSAGPVP